MSEYIPRLRQELVAAATRERAGQRRRVAVRPRRLAFALAAAAIVAALVVALSAIDLASDEEPIGALPAGSALAYRVTTAPGGDPESAAERSAAVLRARIAAIGIEGATVSLAGDMVGVDARVGDLKTIAALAVPGRLAIYDWEASVLGPDGRPAPGDEDVTGGPAAGQRGGLEQYEAVMRAARAQGTSGAPTLWLVEDGPHTVLAGPQPTRDALTRGGPVPDGARVVEVPGGVRVVHPTGVPRWYAIGGGAALGNRDIVGPAAAQDPRTGDPVVAFSFTARGQDAFASLTREVAHRGQAGSRPGQDPMEAVQHLAIVLDDELVSVPFIDFREAPNGIAGRSGAQIQGSLTPERAREIATILSSSPMPGTLVPVR
jgi:SecD/SecF fusion protein